MLTVCIVLELTVCIIDISATPTFTMTPDTPVLGQPLVFTCQRGLQNYQIIFKDEDVINDVNDVMSTSETYTIPAVALSDAGRIWCCLAENSGYPLTSFPIKVHSTGKYHQYLYCIK